MAPRSSAISDGAELLWLHDAAARSIQVAGGKAARLAQLTTARFPVPQGLIVPIGHPDLDPGSAGAEHLAAAIADGLGEETPVAVRSSAAAEDGDERSWAGTFSTELNVIGHDALAQAIAMVVGSVFETTPRGPTVAAPTMAILVQPMIDARLAGVAFTTDDRDHRRSVIVTVVDGLADRLVAGEVTGDEWIVTGDIVTRPKTARTSATIDDMAAVATLAVSVADHYGVPQDIEWAIDTDQLWLLQARPLTAPVSTRVDPGRVADAHTLVGIAASPGRATGPARIVDDSGDLDRIRPGDVLVASTTSPAWTAAFADIAAVVTDIGSAAAHAAIVAREFAIPAVTNTGDATTRLRDGLVVTVDGDHGTVHFD